LSPSALILDACTLINLHACRQMESIVVSIPGQVMIAEQVYDECRLDPFDPDDEIVERTDLARLIERRALTVVTSLTNTELNSFAAFAIRLEDGEAATLALAVHRGWTVVTDDRAAIRELAGQAPLLSTLDLIKTWADTLAITRDVLAVTLADLRVRGRYVPSKSHPLWSWWNQFLTTTR
jgi:predicted nucleic acid-binding protein